MSSGNRSGHFGSAILHLTVRSVLQAEVEKALNGTCSTEAGSSLWEQLVQRAVAHCMKQQLDLQVGLTAQKKCLICTDKAL